MWVYFDWESETKTKGWSSWRWTLSVTSGRSSAGDARICVQCGRYGDGWGWGDGVTEENRSCEQNTWKLKIGTTSSNIHWIISVLSVICRSFGPSWPVYFPVLRGRYSPQAGRVDGELPITCGTNYGWVWPNSCCNQIIMTDQSLEWILSRSHANQPMT